MENLRAGELFNKLRRELMAYVRTVNGFLRDKNGVVVFRRVPRHWFRFFLVEAVAAPRVPPDIPIRWVLAENRASVNENA